MQQPNIQQIKQGIIENNYTSVYNRLLPDEGQINEATRKPPFQIGDKDVHALSDIEGYNIEFLKFLKQLGLVEYQEFTPANLNGWKKCLSLKKGFGENDEFPVYYKFNEEACRKFNDVIVLCGDYVRNTRNTSEGVVNILEELNDRLNSGRKEEHKRLYLIAGNHDIYDFREEERSQHDLKRRILNLGLYPQLLLVNGDNNKFVFQHTNFPYKERDNYIVNKKIDANKAYNLLESNIQLGRPTLVQDNGFFNLRYVVKNNDQFDYQDVNGNQQDREIYSDGGLGYDVKVIGHDTNFAGRGLRQNDSIILNVNLNNWEQKPWKTIYCNRKSLNLQAPPIKPFVPDQKNTEYPKVITFGINNSYTKNIFEKAVSFFCKEKKEILNNNVRIKFYSLNQYNSFKDKLNELNDASR
ncbi:MAG: metallophosphoesterase [Rickettsiales bacterium]|nr:metallophosphoesterase [Rickettsiales bacterium]